MTEPIRVVVADDHPVFLSGLRGLLESRPEISVVGSAANGRAALDVCTEVAPDVVLMDLHMPELNGIEATRVLHEQQPGVGVLVLTMLEDDDSVFAALRAGARGYILKGADQDEIVRAITAVARGEAIFGPAIAERISGFLAPRRGPDPAQPFPQLTEREREILAAIARGETNPVIARRLAISDKTVRNHVSAIFTKLQVADRGQAIIQARDAGLGA